MKAFVPSLVAMGLYFALVSGNLAYAEPKTTDVKPVAPTLKKQPTKLTEGECTGLGGTVKQIAVSIWCMSGQWCSRVDQNGVIISVGCVNGIKN
jgi:hypothetical protein